MLRPIPPVQKLSVLVPETQAPAPKGTIFSCQQSLLSVLTAVRPQESCLCGLVRRFSQPQEEINAIPEESKL